MKVTERNMGEAKNIIQGPENSPGISDGYPTIHKLCEIIDDLDRAIDIKLQDLDGEGTAQKAENHFKLGILRASESLVRRAKALLEDYGTDLEYDTDPSYDEAAVSGDEFETDDSEEN